ncbi:MAG: alpha/beta hydrolase [Polyangiaceae bacterium]
MNSQADSPESSRPRDAMATPRPVDGDEMWPKAIRGLGDVATANARVRYTETGSAASGARPVVFLHDSGNSRATWMPAAFHFPEDVRAVLVDLPGFGESEKPAPVRFAYGYDAFGDAVLDLVAALGLSRVSIVGHGLGAAIAIRLAADVPHVVDRIVLVAPRWGGTRSAFKDRMFALPLLGGFAFRRLERTPDKDGSVHATFLATRDPRTLTASLPRVKARTLAVWGEDDDPTVVANGKRLVREISGSRISVLPGGRAPHEDAPEPFAKALFRFLRADDGRGADVTPPPPSVAPTAPAGKAAKSRSKKRGERKR